MSLYTSTSEGTFSVGEEFVNNMRVLDRATIVGAKTAGGANPGRDYALNEHFILFIPNSRAVNPYDQSNWEGVGVTPHFEVPSEEVVSKVQALINERGQLD